MEREDVQKPRDGELESRMSRTPAAILGRPSDRISSGVQRNLRDLPTVLTPSAWMAGLVAVLIAYTRPLVLVFQAARNAGLDQAHLASWIWALTVGSGLTTLPLCFWYRQPIVIAWSIAGSALLVSGLRHYTLAEAVGAYVVAGLAVASVEWSGVFRRMLARVSGPVVVGILAACCSALALGSLARSLSDLSW